ncbi:hypothetical protein G3T36_01065 [Diaminobutyricibacter tongyongensis]|uniref:Uncharacterized protein n=1 Tax=Leifsonia tongyongensis TaxID=1268043 RepID=A0A6L9XSQ5_9MICO|nr:hypothetical protein [Diaminobutyricibacter tongyongensis]NEN04451.1 hypothetical protein [Diaminobutyricibacter tongyongensis]
MLRPLAAWLDRRSLGSGSSVLDRLAIGGAIASETWLRESDRPPARGRSRPQEVTLVEGETNDLLAAIAEAAEVTGGDLQALGMRLTRKWGLGDTDLSRLASRISRALGVPDPVAAIEAPPSLDRFVDQAMFVPLPPVCRTVILVSPHYRMLSARDPFAASRLLLAVAHEVAGHACDYRALMPIRPQEARLDRELLEGWGIVAEGRLSGLGLDEHALHLLYQVKRLLPLAQRSLDEPSWMAMRNTIEATWPGFFTSAATAVLRRATGTHARGLVRVRRALQVHGEAARSGLASPWT